MIRPVQTVLLLALAPAATAQDLIAVEWSGALHRIDGTTFATTVIGSTGFGGSNCLARSSDGSYWTFASARLVSFDPATWAATQVGTSNVNDVRGLAFDDADTLYALVDSSGNDELWIVDRTTALATRVGDTGRTSLQSLAYANGALYTHDNVTIGGDRGLYTVDPTTGFATDVNPLVGACPSDVQTIWADAGGRLFAGRWDLMSFDAASGVCTQLRTLGVLDVRGIEAEGMTGLSSAADAISVGAGGAQVLDVDVGAAHGGALDLVAGSLSGESPGTSYAGATVPLNLDAYTVFTIVNPNTPPLASSAGTLDGAGRAAVTFSLPAGSDPGLVGLEARHAAVVLAPGGFLGLARVTNAVACRLDP